jgi:branched-chain amino acid transport system substrate-binding protein
MVLCNVPARAETADTAAGSKAPIKIGFLAPLTGVAAQGGPDLVNGIKLFFEQNHYQIAGRKVELIIENDESSAATAVGKIHKFVKDDKVNILDGMILSNMAYAVAPVVDQYQVPMVFPISASDDLTKRKHYRWIVRTGWSASQPAHPFGEYVFKKLGYKKVVTLGVDYAMAWEMIGGFQRTFEEAGGKVIQKIWAPLGFRDFSQYIKQIRPDADAIFTITAVDSADIVAKQIKEFGPKLPIIGGGPSYDETTLHNVGDPTLGAITTYYYSAALDRPEMKKFMEAYRAKYGVDPGLFAEGAYVSGMWIKKALEAVHGDAENKEQLLAALKKVELPNAPRGPMKMDEFGNPIENIYIRKVEKKDGRLENVVIETFPKVSQFWKYNPEAFLKQPPYSRDYPPCRYCQ